MLLSFVAFGYKYGLVADADVIFDVRCLPNPFYVEGLRGKTGLDTEAAILELHDGRSNGNTTLLFDLHPVGGGGAGILLTLNDTVNSKLNSSSTVSTCLVSLS